jgi:hypothetical protein
MPGLDRSIIEHRLPIKPGYQPYQQGARQCKPEVLPDIKAEITRLIETKFIRRCRYAKWISNVVPVYKKNGKLRVCIDFRNLNNATPMDRTSSALWMAMRGITRSLWQRKISQIQRLDAPDMLVCISGLS